MSLLMYAHPPPPNQICFQIYETRQECFILQLKLLYQKSYHDHVDKISSSENFTENSMVNLSPIANNLLTSVLPTFSDDYTNTYTVIDLEFNYSNVENLPDPITILNEIRIKFVKNVIIEHLNINALANKFDALNFIIRDKLNILVLCETKLDTTFPERQFLLTGFKKTI